MPLNTPVLSVSKSGNTTTFTITGSSYDSNNFIYIWKVDGSLLTILGSMEVLGDTSMEAVGLPSNYTAVCISQEINVTGANSLTELSLNISGGYFPGVLSNVVKAPSTTTGYNLSDSPADVIAQLLIDLELASDPGNGSGPPSSPWPVYSSADPDALLNIPDDCISITDTTGQSDGVTALDGRLLYHYGFQIKVRSSDHPTGWHMAEQIRWALAAYGAPLGDTPAETIVLPNSNQYSIPNIAHIGPVIPLGKETPSTKRSEFTINALAPISPA